MKLQAWKFTCVPTCPLGGSNSARGLSIHQSSCKHSREQDRLRASELSRKQREARQAEKKAIYRARTALPKRISSQVAPPMDVDIPVEVPVAHDTLFPDLDPLPSDTPPTPEPPVLGRGRRVKRPTWKVMEQQTLSPQEQTATASTPLPPQDPLPQFEDSSTQVDRYGLYCKYLSCTPTASRTRFTPTPIHFVEPITQIPSCLRKQNLSKPDNPTNKPSSATEALTQCSNISSQLIMEWHWATPVKSLDDTNKLVHDVFLHAKREHLLKFDAHAETRRIDAAIAKMHDGWREVDVNIHIPDGQTHSSPDDPTVPIFTVPGLLHRSIVEIIRAVWTSADSADFQYVPFRQFWTRSKSGVEEQVHGELYTSEVFNDAYRDLQNQPPEPGCLLERVICGIMLYSDSTHLTSFGNASLWPLYMFFGNQSKYVRACPSTGSCHHVAYIPKVW